MVEYQYEYYYFDGTEVTREEFVEMTLDAVGKSVFSKYYYDFKRGDPEVYKLIEENYSDNSKKKRTYHAINLFAMGLQKDALVRVMHAQKIDPALAAHAKAVYSIEFRNEINK